jgi:hypothetical protein
MWRAKGPRPAAGVPGVRGGRPGVLLAVPGRLAPAAAVFWGGGGTSGLLVQQRPCGVMLFGTQMSLNDMHPILLLGRLSLRTCLNQLPACASKAQGGARTAALTWRVGHASWPEATWPWTTVSMRVLLQDAAAAAARASR